ncbi:hypothetical protein BK011_09015 [Tenericutes bacterium MZ-XQ]|nr:hypothetical protein BK011_09015 [Tenericutes bacterium MZ-XQ]
MLKRIENQHLNDVLKFLYKDPIYNCYIISDIETLGVDHPYLSLYGVFHQDEVKSVCMIFDRYAFYSSQTDEVDRDMIDLILSKQLASISGSRDSISRLMKNLNFDKETEYMLAVLSDDHKVDHEFTSLDIKVLESEQEIKDLYHMLVDIHEFNVKSLTVDEFISEKKVIHEAGQTYGLFDHNQLCSTASALSETKQHAVINGVATKNDYRNKGYARKLIDRIIYDYITIKGKELILYYDNPIAAKMYLDKGFKPYGTWITLDLKKAEGK